MITTTLPDQQSDLGTQYIKLGSSEHVCKVMAWLLRYGHNLARCPVTIRAPYFRQQCARAFFFSSGMDESKMKSVRRSRSRRNRRKPIPPLQQDDGAALEARPRSRSRRKRRTAARPRKEDLETVEETQPESLPKGTSRVVVVSPKVSTRVSNQSAREPVQSSESWIGPARVKTDATKTEDAFVEDEEMALQDQDLATCITELESNLPEPDLDLMSRYGHNIFEAFFLSILTGIMPSSQTTCYRFKAY